MAETSSGKNAAGALEYDCWSSGSDWALVDERRFTATIQLRLNKKGDVDIKVSIYDDDCTVSKRPIWRVREPHGNTPYTPIDLKKTIHEEKILANRHEAAFETQGDLSPLRMTAVSGSAYWAVPGFTIDGHDRGMHLSKATTVTTAGRRSQPPITPYTPV